MMSAISIRTEFRDRMAMEGACVCVTSRAESGWEIALGLFIAYQPNGTKTLGPQRRKGDQMMMELPIVPS